MTLGSLWGYFGLGVILARFRKTFISLIDSNDFMQLRDQFHFGITLESLSSTLDHFDFGLTLSCFGLTFGHCRTTSGHVGIILG